MFTKLFSWVSKTLSLLCFGIIASMLATTAQAGVKIQQWKTAQGAQVLFVENHDLPILDISTGFHAGSARDADNKTGVAGLTRFMMTLGAGGLSDEQIAKKMADIGATLGGGVNADQSSFTLRTQVINVNVAWLWTSIAKYCNNLISPLRCYLAKRHA